ncbi:MAG: glycosyltransferase [Chitinivibrionales bacterium]|nr:glycosyltransferase [Chitinivibrionales bacterium]
MKTPRVSVIVPIYNMAATLPETLQSLLAQSWSDFEVIVINDGSTDTTESVIKNTAAMHPSLIAHDQPHGGKVSALNRGIALSSGDFITIVDADDTLPENSLRDRAEFLHATPDAMAVYGNADYINKEGKPYRTRSSYPVFRKNDIVCNFRAPIIGPTLMVRKVCMNRIAPLDETLLRSIDKYLALEIFSCGQVFFLDKVVYNYRTYPGQSSCAKRFRQWYDLSRIINRHFDNPTQSRVLIKQTVFHLMKAFYESFTWQK